jgi:L-ascorbate metabolism protein UlaG (beta-lactamase superfamily)
MSAESTGSKRARRPLWLRVVLGVLGVIALLVVVVVADVWSALGTRPDAEKLGRLAKQSRFSDGRFHDTIPRVEPDIWAATRRWIAGTEHSQPSSALPTLMRSRAEFVTPSASGLRITWFGHSSLLLELEGRRVLIDPVWGERCSPSSFTGPKRFHPVPLPLEALPPLDAVVISHDHYDHLDYPTGMALTARNVPFVVPLGVGAHLEYWGIDPKLVRELDWWGETEVAGLKLVATPARHFSGRGLGNDRTLWPGGAVLGAQTRAYYSGDTAMLEGFAEIGKRLGLFDATMIEVGAYDALWADVHLGPEQAVEAHRQVRGGVLFPVHWGTFDLALHTWVEPGERVLEAARRAEVRVVLPKPGQSIDPLAPPQAERWWPPVPWKKASETPVVSSGLARAR